MTRVIRLSEYTSLEDVASWTSQSTTEDVLFKVSIQSGFAPTVEGTALGALQQMVDRMPVAAMCTFDLERDAKIWESVFGIALVLASCSVLGPDGKDGKAIVAGRLWKNVMQSRGQIGTGNRAGIVFRDPDYALPHCLRSVEPDFPKRDFFRLAMEKAAQRMGYQGSFSESESDVITFLYEAAQNADEHARLDSEARAVLGIRGILFDRVTIKSSSELEARRDLLPFQREYLRQIGTSGRWPLVAFAFTVADLGPGIHHTLPALPDEAPWERLRRAFLVGVTRKQPGIAVEAGLGLSKLHESAARLRALLFVRSAELSGYTDFSSTSRQLERLALFFGTVGTSLTLMWPATKTGGDQGSLFDGT